MDVMIKKDKIVPLKVEKWSGRSWQVYFNLTELCKSEGRKVKVAEYGCPPKMVTDYPVTKVRKVFKLFCQYIQDDATIDDIQTYLDKHSEKYAKMFREIREKLNR